MYIRRRNGCWPTQLWFYGSILLFLIIYILVRRSKMSNMQLGRSHITYVTGAFAWTEQKDARKPNDWYDEEDDDSSPVFSNEEEKYGEKPRKKKKVEPPKPPKKSPPVANIIQYDYSLYKCFDHMKINLPYIIIDKNMLLAIRKDCRNLIKYPIQIAVHQKFKGKIKETDGVFSVNITYYEVPKGSDYYLFHTPDGDKAVRKFPMSSYRNIYAPLSPFQFMTAWENGDFQKCLGWEMKRNASITPKLIDQKFARHLAEYRDFLSTRGARMFLAGGTLLGWYRECAFIPHSGDLDVAIFEDEYNQGILNDMDRRDSPYHVFRIYGKREDSLEIGAYVKNGSQYVYIDLFLLYSNKTTAWMAGLDWTTKEKYIWTYPRITKLCTGALYNRLFYVPCNFKDILQVEYGNWTKEVMSSKFAWNKSHKNIAHFGNFTEEETVDMREN